MDKKWVPLDPSPLVATHQQPTFFHASPSNTLTPANHGTKDNTTPPDDLVEDDAAVSILTDNLGQMAMEPKYRFFGKSSATRLIQAAINLKTEYTQSAEPFSKEFITPTFSKTKFWAPQDVRWPLDFFLFISLVSSKPLLS